MATIKEKQWKFTIYLVGFPDIKGDPTIIPITAMMETLIPEARVLKHTIFRGGTLRNPKNQDPSNELADPEDGCGPKELDLDDGGGIKDGAKDEEAPGLENVLETTVAELDTLKQNIFLPEWIDSEAMELLGRIERNILREKRSFRHKIVLAGYGFGGIIIKKAVITANSALRFQDLAFTIDSLLFIATPHRSSTQLAWEELLLRMLNATGISYRDRLSEILSGLIRSVSQLSNVFHIFAAKYKITNMIGKECSDEYDPMRFNSTFEEVISRSKTHHEMLCCSIHDVEYLELMRKAFTPRAVHQDISMQNYRLQLDARIDSYAELLERLSPVRWLIYNNRKTEYMEHFETLKQIYQPFLIEAFTKEILGCSVEVVSPNIHGGLTLLKLLCQEIIETSTAVVIESNSSLQIGECSRYNMCMSFIHQIITQRPSLFRPIQSMTTEVLSQNIWTEEVLHLLLYSILIHSNGTHFVVAIYDFESWPLELHSWLSRIQNTISKANGSTLSILTCSRNEITGLPREKTNKIIISPEEHTTLMKAFIHTKVDHFLGENRVSDLAKKELRKRIWKIASPLAQSFDGSFSTMNIYLVQLIRSISLTSVNAIKSAVGSIQVTSEKIYEHCLQELLNKPRKVRFWAYKVLSWLLFTVRPLHIKELAIAVALRLEKLTLKNIRENISIDMDKDIRDYLGPLVRIEDQFVYLDSQKLKDILLCSNGNFLKKAEIIGDRDLARLSIRYLSLIFARAHEKKATWDNCLSKLSNKNQGLSYDEPELHFLEYACRFWPTHLQRGRALDRDTINEVKDFFTQKSDITNMWFRLYLLCHGQRSNPFTEDPERQRAKTQIPDAYDNIGDVADIYEPQSAAEMAGYVGLSDVVPFLLSESETDTFKEITIRRGYWDHKVVIQNTKSMHYLDLIIENADTVDECFSANQKEMSSHFPLHRAVISGCLGATKVLFNFISNHHPILSEVDSDGRTPLHMAALCGSEAVLRFLIDKAVSGKLPGMNTEGDILDAKDYHSETALIAAVRMGNVDAAKILLESGARVNIQDGSGRTALHFAASNCPQLIRSLMDQNNDAAIMADQDGCNPLHIAIKYGSRDGIMILFEAYRRLTCFSQIVSANDNDGKTALHYAAERGFEDITRQLIAPEGMQMANVDDIQRAAELAAINGHLAALRAIIGQEEIRNFGHQILSVAVSAGQLLVVCYLLQNNVSLNEKLNDGNIILSIASSKGFTEIVRILLQHGADVIATDSERRTPLHHAAGHGMYEIAQILLGHQPEHGQLLKIEACDLERYTPLHYAARAGEVKMVEFLLQKNAEIDAQSVKEETPLHVAVKNSTVMRLLIDAGAEVNALDYYGRTPLHLAVSEGSLESVRFLLEKGASWDFVDYEKKSPMRYAIDADDATIVEAILQFQSRLQKGPEIPSNDLVSVFKSSALGTAKVLVNQLPEIITRRDANDHTLLHIAAESSEVGMLTLLLDAGSDMSALNKNGETPLFRAAIFNKADNLRLLIKRGGKIDQSRTDGWMILHIAAYLDRTESAVVLLEAGAALNKPAVHQATPLFLAAQQNKAKMVELLLEKGADPNMTATDGWSPLQAHISSNHPDESGLGICGRLVSHNANVNHQTDNGWTALHFAINQPKSKEHTMNFLLNNGADPNIPNKDGLTAFHLSFDKGLAKSMLDHPKAGNIDLEKMTRAGMAPIHLAVEKSEFGIVQRILNKGVGYKVKTVHGLSCLDLAAGRDTSDILETLLNRDWGIDDIVSAYWSAIRKLKVDNVKLLVTKRESLLDETYDKGLGGLETCLLMRPRREIEQATSLAVYFLEKEGENLFCKRESLNMSIFELCVFSQAKFNAELLQACLKYLPKHSETLGLGYRELRIATEINKDDLDLWDRLKHLRRLITEEKDQDGWNMDQFLYQAEPRQSYDTWDAEAIKCATKMPTALIIPSLWQVNDPDIQASVNISPDGLEATFTETRDRQIHIRSIRSNFPFPLRNLGQSYFEVTVHDLGREGIEAATEEPLSEAQPVSRSDLPTICIGFSGEFSVMKHAHPGWNVWSAGYHGREGKVYHENCSLSEAVATDRTYGPGDTVGCGIDYTEGNYFFTHNGKIVSRQKSNIIYRKLYPTISHARSGCKVTVNFGDRDFAWEGAISGPK